MKNKKLLMAVGAGLVVALAISLGVSGNLFSGNPLIAPKNASLLKNVLKNKPPKPASNPQPQECKSLEITEPSTDTITINEGETLMQNFVVKSEPASNVMYTWNSSNGQGIFANKANPYSSTLTSMSYNNVSVEDGMQISVSSGNVCKDVVTVKVNKQIKPTIQGSPAAVDLDVDPNITINFTLPEFETATIQFSSKDDPSEQIHNFMVVNKNGVVSLESDPDIVVTNSGNGTYSFIYTIPAWDENGKLLNSGEYVLGLSYSTPIAPIIFGNISEPINILNLFEETPPMIAPPDLLEGNGEGSEGEIPGAAPPENGDNPEANEEPPQQQEEPEVAPQQYRYNP